MSPSAAVRPRAVAYVRVSKEREGMVSPELQQHEIETFAKRQGFELVEVVADLDLSGREFAKRSVTPIIDGISEGRWTHVLLWKWSRWGRNVLESLTYLKAVEEAGGVVRAATEDMDASTSMGKFSRDQALLIAELQSNQISEGWKEAHERLRRKGLTHNGRARWGYDYERGKGHTHSGAAEIVAESYTRAVSGESFRAIALDLNRRGHLSPGGKQWSQQMLRNALDTGFAAGLIRERSDTSGPRSYTFEAYDVWREGAHEPIIDAELWQRYADMRRGRTKRTRGRSYAFTGLIHCGECGSRMYLAATGRGTRYWRCQAVVERKAHVALTVRHEAAEAAVLDWLEDHAGKTPEGLSEALGQAQAASVATDAGETLKAELSTLLSKRKRLVSLYTDGIIARDDYEEQYADIAERVATLETSIRDTGAAERHAGQDVKPEQFKELRKAWEKLSPERQNEALRAVVGRIDVAPGKGDGRVSILSTYEAA